MATMTDKIVDKLNSLLRGELSAIEMYKQALGSVKMPAAQSELTECERSHEQRVAKLKDRVRQLGGIPVEGPGVRGAFAKIVQGGADVFGDKAAIAALEEGEDRGLADYRRSVDEFDTETRSLIEQELLPAQMRTHRAMSALKHSIH